MTCTVCELHAESTFKIEGMDCQEEVALIRRRFENLRGLESFSADVMGQRLHVKYDAAKLSTAAISDAVADAGMRAWLEHEEPLHAAGPSWLSTSLVVGSGAALGAGLAGPLIGLPPPVSTMLFALSIAAGVPLTARKAWRAIRLLSLDINVLMIVAVAGAIALNEWSEAASVVFLFVVAQTLEVYTLERARTAVRALMDLTPLTALVRDERGERRVGVDDLAPGSLIVVKPGEKVPLDGEVVAGESAVNQAPVTGESLPVDRRPGDEVFAGSINGRGALDVRVTRGRRDTTVARITHLVERAQAQRAPSQTLVERFARVYTPAVLVFAAALWLIPVLAFGGDWHTWTYRALVLLVVACPCALVISTPVSIVAALAGAARKGVLIKGGAHLERAARIRCIAFDKTGTLTLGVPEVVGVTPMAGVPPAAIVGLAASVEHRSTHPIARAILRHAERLHVESTPGLDVQELSGRGAEGRVGGVHVLIGNHRLFEERRLCSPELHAELDALSERGHTPVFVASDNRAIGIIAVADRPRPVSREALEALRQHGVDSIVMLTGDHAATARAVARELGVEDVRADLLPEDKVAAVQELRARYGHVAMVGDGINDAPALASADVGMAMGAAGSNVALETADVALMGDDLLKVPYAIRLSRATVTNIKVNLGISLVLKAAFVVAAAAGVATLWMAVLADTGASIIVVANALRLLRAD
jgi:Cd2+/Zn2+-exporting ATPase